MASRSGARRAALSGFLRANPILLKKNGEILLGLLSHRYRIVSDPRDNQPMNKTEREQRKHREKEADKNG